MQQNRKSGFAIFAIVLLAASLLSYSAFAQEFGTSIESYSYEPIHSEVLADFEDKDSDYMSNVIIEVRETDGSWPKDMRAVEGVYEEMAIPERSEIVSESVIGAQMTRAEVEALSQNERVLTIVWNAPAVPQLADVANIIDAEEVWALESQGQNMNGESYSVCLLDTGVDFSHPDLASKNIMGGNMVFSSTTNSYIVNPSFVPTESHGTRMAGILAAEGGVTGIGNGVNIISFVVSTSLDMQKALQWCGQNADQYNIIAISSSNSHSTQIYSDEASCVAAFPTYNALIDALYSSKGIYYINSAGNQGSDQGITRPACMPNAIAVGATDKQDNRANFPGWWGSNYYAPLMKLFAPGVDTLTTNLGGGYLASSGTSAATPVVSGSVAILSQYLRLNGKDLPTPMEMEQLLFDTGEQINDLPSSDFRRINLYNAIMALDVDEPQVIVAGRDGWFDSGENIEVALVIEDDLSLDECYYTINGGSNVNFNCSEELISLGNLAEGNYNVAIYAKDLAGNTGNSEVVFGVDETAPVVDIKSHDPIAHIFSPNIHLKYRITDALSGLDSCWYEVNGGEAVEIDCGSNSFNVQASSISTNVEVFAMDGAGNVHSDTALFMLKRHQLGGGPTGIGVCLPSVGCV